MIKSLPKTEMPFINWVRAVLMSNNKQKQYPNKSIIWIHNCHFVMYDPKLFPNDLLTLEKQCNFKLWQTFS